MALVMDAPTDMGVDAPISRTGCSTNLSLVNNNKPIPDQQSSHSSHPFAYDALLDDIVDNKRRQFSLSVGNMEYMRSGFGKGVNDLTAVETGALDGCDDDPYPDPGARKHRRTNFGQPQLEPLPAHPVLSNVQNSALPRTEDMVSASRVPPLQRRPPLPSDMSQGAQVHEPEVPHRLQPIESAPIPSNSSALTRLPSYSSAARTAAHNLKPLPNSTITPSNLSAASVPTSSESPFTNALPAKRNLPAISAAMSEIGGGAVPRAVGSSPMHRAAVTARASQVAPVPLPRLTGHGSTPPGGLDNVVLPNRPLSPIVRAVSMGHNLRAHGRSLTETGEPPASKSTAESSGRPGSK